MGNQHNGSLGATISMETCHLIVQNVSSRRDICSLSRVCRSFRVAAERVLYNTLYLSGSRNTMKLCETLAKQSCVSVYVEALTISRTDEEDKRGGEVALSTDYWNAIADVLCATTRLRHLTIHLEDVAGFEHAWILDECKFKLRTFHCDLDWDSSLARFLEMQTELVDLYLLDFPHPDSCPSLDASSDSSTLSSQLDISPDSLPALSVVECPTTDAVETLVPRRPITRIKTSLSSSTPEGKREEMDRLFTSLRLSTKNILSIDLADPSYSSELSLLLLRCCTADCRTRAELRHLAALILPVDGPERLQLYGLLMQFSQLQCIEVDVSDWHPAPMSFPALRALTNEIRLYCSSILRVVFVYEFDRVVMKIEGSRCSLDEDWQNADTMWREA